MIAFAKSPQTAVSLVSNEQAGYKITNRRFI